MTDKITMRVLRHWADNVESAIVGEDFGLGVEGCAYCEKYHSWVGSDPDNCSQCDAHCPIMINVGLTEGCGCMETPYEDLADHEPTLETTLPMYDYLLSMALSQDLITLDDIDLI